jgi:hypothetical protein
VTAINYLQISRGCAGDRWICRGEDGEDRDRAVLRTAREAGPWTSEALDRRFRDATGRQQAAEALLAIAERATEAGIEPMSTEEIDSEIRPIAPDGGVRAVVDTIACRFRLWFLVLAPNGRRGHAGDACASP